MQLRLRGMQKDDWSAVCEIYQLGIDTGNATFQTEVPSWDEWNAGHIDQCRTIALLGDKIVGWVALSAYSKRHVYRGVAEVSIYVHSNYSGWGIGKKLMIHLISESEKLGFWTLTSSILPENLASIALHQKAGFRKVGYREKLAESNGIWRDVLIFEKRKRIFGVDTHLNEMHINN